MITKTTRFEDAELLFHGGAVSFTIPVNSFLLSRTSDCFQAMVNNAKNETMKSGVTASNVNGRLEISIDIRDEIKNGVTGADVSCFFDLMSDFGMRSLSDGAIQDARARAEYDNHKSLISRAHRSILPIHALAHKFGSTRVLRWIDNQMPHLLTEDSAETLLDYILILLPKLDTEGKEIPAKEAKALKIPDRYVVSDQGLSLYSMLLLWRHCLRSPRNPQLPPSRIDNLENSVDNHAKYDIFSPRTILQKDGTIELAGCIVKCASCCHAETPRWKTTEGHSHPESRRLAKQVGQWSVTLSESRDSSGERDMILWRVPPAIVAKRSNGPVRISKEETRLFRQAAAESLVSKGNIDEQTYECSVSMCFIRRGTRQFSSFKEMTLRVPTFLASDTKCAVNRPNIGLSDLWRCKIGLSPHYTVTDYYTGTCDLCKKTTQVSITAYNVQIVPVPPNDPMDVDHR